MIITKRHSRHSKRCDFGAQEETLVRTAPDSGFTYVAQTPLRIADGSRYVEINFSGGRILLTRAEAEMIKRRLGEVTLP